MTDKTLSVSSAGRIFSIFIPYDPPNWNQYIDMERTNKFKASKLKKKEKELVADFCDAGQGYHYVYTGGYPAQLIVRPCFKNMRKDLDNTRYKGILDGLVAAGVIKNDNLKHIQRIIIEPTFCDSEGIGIIIKPLEES